MPNLTIRNISTRLAQSLACQLYAMGDDLPEDRPPGLPCFDAVTTNLETGDVTMTARDIPPASTEVL